MPHTLCRNIQVLFLSLPVLFLSPTPVARADIVEFNDGNLIEGKLIKIERDRKGEVYVVQDEEGKEERYTAAKVKQIVRCTTSWEKKAKREAWYAKALPKVKDTWKSHERFAYRCYKKHLRDQGTEHYLKAYELRKHDLKEGDEARLKLADWLDKCQLFDEAQEERRTVYQSRRIDVERTVAAHLKLAKWANRHELLDETAEQYEEVLRLAPKHKTAIAKLERVRDQLEIPMDPGFYKSARLRVRAAARFLRGKQGGDGHIGSDCPEGGVHGMRAMCALSAMALIADWDFAVLSGREEPDEAPEEIGRVLDYLKTFTPSVVERFGGDDVWGPIFALDFYLECLGRQAFADHHDEIKELIGKTITELLALQRPDGGWMYYNFVQTSASFVTASAVVSLARANGAGFPVEQSVFDRAVKLIQSLRQGHGTFTYSAGLPQGPVGACARSPACELALSVCGATKVTSLKHAIDIFFANRHILEGLRGSALTHIGEGKTAPYYLLFAHYWTSRAIKHLPRRQQRSYLNRLGGGLVAYQEGDGTFYDFTGTKDYRIYGTALAALTLYHLASLRREVGQEDLVPEEVVEPVPPPETPGPKKKPDASQPAGETGEGATEQGKPEAGKPEAGKPDGEKKPKPAPADGKPGSGGPTGDAKPGDPKRVGLLPMQTTQQRCHGSF